MLTGIVIDALDVARMDRFWSDAGRTDGLRLRFVPTAKPKTAHKNRLHLDLAGGPDWATEVARLLALGATRVDIGQGDVPWDVLADPEGNKFCVLRPGHAGVLADSGLVAICLDVAEEDRDAQGAFWQSQADWPGIESHDWGVRLRRKPVSTVSLVMGPPAAPKEARNRLRLEVTRHDREPGEFLDAGANEFHVTGGPSAFQRLFHRSFGIGRAAGVLPDDHGRRGFRYACRPCSRRPAKARGPLAPPLPWAAACSLSVMRQKWQL